MLADVRERRPRRKPGAAAHDEFQQRLAVLTLVLTGNAREGFADLAHGRIQRWSDSMDERYELIRTVTRAGPADLVLARPPDPPGLFARMDLSSDPGHWKNGCAARYFGLRSVALEKPAPTKE